MIAASRITLVAGVAALVVVGIVISRSHVIHRGVGGDADLDAMGLGARDSGEVVDFIVELRNDRDREVTDLQFDVTCSCLSVLAQPDALAPNSRTPVSLRLQSPQRPGPFDFLVLAASETSADWRQTVRVFGTVKQVGSIYPAAWSIADTSSALHSTEFVIWGMDPGTEFSASVGRPADVDWSRMEGSLPVSTETVGRPDLRGAPVAVSVSVDDSLIAGLTNGSERVLALEIRALNRDPPATFLIPLEVARRTTAASEPRGLGNATRRLLEEVGSR